MSENPNEITIVINDFQRMALHYNVPDWKIWVMEALLGKINNCVSRVAEAEKKKLVEEDAAMMPTKITDLANAHFSRADYTDRKGRDAKEAEAFAKINEVEIGVNTNA